MSNDLKKQLLKLGSTNPELRPHLRPVLAKIASKGLLETVFDRHKKALLALENDLEKVIQQYEEISAHSMVKSTYQIKKAIVGLNQRDFKEVIKEERAWAKDAKKS